MDELKNKKLFLLDMDGTIYVDSVLIPGAENFINTLISQGKDYVFLTNNSSKSTEEYINKLRKLNIPADESNIFTSANATTLYLKNSNKDLKLYVVGTSSFKKHLEKEGFIIFETYNEEVNCLVIAYDTELTYEKLDIACRLLKKDILYIATNPDLVCPTRKNEFIPDCGSFCQMIKNATKKEPIVIGKPNREMIETVAQMKNKSLNEFALIGDRLYTDIACSLNAGVTSILVLTGETKKEDLHNTRYTPDYIFDSIYDIWEILESK